MWHSKIRELDLAINSNKLKDAKNLINSLTKFNPTGITVKSLVREGSEEGEQTKDPKEIDKILK